MGYELIESIWTIVLLVTFIAIVIWAWGSKRKKTFDEAARLPLEDDTKPPFEEKHNE
jgi:cytochrome c oxidase cbb3-type subunit 4